MLQFWKKSGLSKAKSEPNNSSKQTIERSGSLDQTLPNGIAASYSLNNDPQCGGPLSGLREEELCIGDLGSSENNDKTPKHKSSRLSKTLKEVLADKGALGYFIQYMDTRQKIGLIKFWLDAESFCAATKCMKTSPCEETSSAHVSWAVTREYLEWSADNDTSSVASNEECSRSSSVETREQTQLDIVHEESSDISLEKVDKIEEPIISRAESLNRDALMDAVRIYRKYLSCNAVKKQAVQISDSLKNAVIDQICREDGQVDSECFSEAQEYAYEVMDKEFFNDFLRSDFHCKHQIDVLTSGNVTLSDILFNETALFHFAEFMEQEGNQSLLEFLLAATNFQQQLLEKHGVYDAMEAQNDAIILYDKYFSLQATCPLGFSDKVRFDVEQNICREEGPLPNCFEHAANVVFFVLQKNYFQLFLSSQLYLKYLSELINTIQSSQSLLGRRRSDCSSDHSLSSLTLPSEDCTKKVIHNVDEREMSIDSRQLYDPDSLWRRRHQSGLSLGRINELGRFETDFEPEPDRKGESRLSRVVRKFVNLEEDKAKEEMAWQIAAMIVKDVTSITLAQPKPTVTEKQSSGS